MVRIQRQHIPTHEVQMVETEAAHAMTSARCVFGAYQQLLANFDAIPRSKAPVWLAERQHPMSLDVVGPPCSVGLRCGVARAMPPRKPPGPPAKHASARSEAIQAPARLRSTLAARASAAIPYHGLSPQNMKSVYTSGS